jgi:hypothetical protein
MEEGFKAPPAFLQRIAKFNMIKFNNGKFLAWGAPSQILPIFGLAYQRRVLEKFLKIEEIKTIYYNLGLIQGNISFNTIAEKFGMAKKYQDKAAFIKFYLGVSDAIGMGLWEPLKIDFDNEIFMGKGTVSPFAEEYKNIYGVQPYAIDDFIRGEATAMIQNLIGKKCITMETSCIAKGQPMCVIKIKPEDKWAGDPDYDESQKPLNIYTLEDLNAKISKILI